MRFGEIYSDRYINSSQGIPTDQQSVLIVTAEASEFAAASAPTAAFLNACGASAELLRLEDHGVHGNGHGLIYEKNSDEALAPVLDWLTRQTEPAGEAIVD